MWNAAEGSGSSFRLGIAVDNHYIDKRLYSKTMSLGNGKHRQVADVQFPFRDGDDSRDLRG